MGEEVLGGIGRGGEWESRAGPVGDIKRCAEQRRWKITDKSHNETQGGNATDAQTANRNLRSTPWWWNGRDGAPGYERRVRNILAVSQIDWSLMTAGRSNEPVLPFPMGHHRHWVMMLKASKP